MTSETFERKAPGWWCVQVGLETRLLLDSLVESGMTDEGCEPDKPEKRAAKRFCD